MRLNLVLGAGVACLMLSLPAAAEVPISDFVRKSEFLSAKISPNGDYLAVAMPVGDQTALGVIDLKTRKVSGSMRFNRGEHVADFWWKAPDRVVATIANRSGPLDSPRLTGEIVAMNADGSSKDYLFGYRGKRTGISRLKGPQGENAFAFMIDTLPYDPLHMLVTIQRAGWNPEIEDVMVERLNVFDGSHRGVTLIPRHAPIDVAADRSGRPVLAQSNDAQARPQLFTLDGPRGELRPLRLPGAALEAIEFERVAADGTAFVTTQDATGRTCLRSYRADSGFQDLTCGESGLHGDPVFTFDDSKPIAFVSPHGPPDVKYLDAEHPDARFRQVLQKAFGNQRIAITSRTLDGSKLVLFVYSDRNPGEYFLVDRKTGKAEYLVSARQWIDPEAMAPSETITYKTRDGATIQGYLTARGGLAARKMPLVLIPHGGPHGPFDRWGWDPWAQALASRGYATLQVNFRGSGGYGSKHQSAGYHKWGTLMQDDLTDAVRWAIDSGVADANRVCIFGASYGGYAALMSPTREPDLYRCAIGFAGVYDLVAQSDTTDTSDYLLGRNILKRYLGDAATMREQSPVTHIAKLKVPVLIAHGTYDERVPFSQAKILRKALEKHGKAYEWMEFDREEHGFWVDKNHEAFLTKVLEFLDKHIGPDSAVAKGQ